MNLPVVDMPRPIRFRPPAPMTDEELFLFSARNEVVWIEREANGEIHIKPISGTLVGALSASVMCDLSQWVKRAGQGKMLAGAGFFLADGSILGPRIVLVSQEKWATVARREKDGFGQFAPDFVVEFSGPWMNRARWNRRCGSGSRMASRWDGSSTPIEKSVTIYRPGEEPENLARPTSVQARAPSSASNW